MGNDLTRDMTKSDSTKMMPITQANMPKWCMRTNIREEEINDIMQIKVKDMSILLTTIEQAANNCERTSKNGANIRTIHITGPL